MRPYGGRLAASATWRTRACSHPGSSGTAELRPVVESIGARCQLLLGASAHSPLRRPPLPAATPPPAALQACLCAHAPSPPTRRPPPSALPLPPARARMTLDLHKLESGEASSLRAPSDVRAILREVAEMWFWDSSHHSSGGATADTEAVSVDSDVPERLLARRALGIGCARCGGRTSRRRIGRHGDCLPFPSVPGGRSRVSPMVLPPPPPLRAPGGSRQALAGPVLRHADPRLRAELRARGNEKGGPCGAPPLVGGATAPAAPGGEEQPLQRRPASFGNLPAPPPRPPPAPRRTSSDTQAVLAESTRRRSAADAADSAVGVRVGYRRRGPPTRPSSSRLRTADSTPRTSRQRPSRRLSAASARTTAPRRRPGGREVARCVATRCRVVAPPLHASVQDAGCCCSPAAVPYALHSGPLLCRPPHLTLRCAGASASLRRRIVRCGRRGRPPARRAALCVKIVCLRAEAAGAGAATVPACAPDAAVSPHAASPPHDAPALLRAPLSCPADE